MIRKSSNQKNPPGQNPWPPKAILAIDPGQCSGWALFGPYLTLEACGLHSIDLDKISMPGEIKAKYPWSPFGLQREFAVIESPVIYPGGRTADPNSIVKLARNAGEWAGLCASVGLRVEYVSPRDWKGTIDPDIVLKRVYEALNADEKAIVDAHKLPKSKRHNLIDAIGIGLKTIGRNLGGQGPKSAKDATQLGHSYTATQLELFREI